MMVDAIYLSVYRWTPNLAYAIGLITTDGSLSKDGRHIDLTSKDLEQIENFRNILKLSNKIGLKKRGTEPKLTYYRVQFGDVRFYKFLLSIGLFPHKSNTIKSVEIPDKFFADFLRGCLDGDGCTSSFFSSQWKNSFVLYMSFASGSLNFLKWLEKSIERLYKAKGAIEKRVRGSFQLRYAKIASLKLIEKMYYSDDIPCLKRKRSKIEASLGIIESQAGVVKR